MKTNSMQGKIREFVKISGKSQVISPERPTIMKTFDVYISLFV
jgi:hypothetical protein